MLAACAPSGPASVTRPSTERPGRAARYSAPDLTLPTGVIWAGDLDGDGYDDLIDTERSSSTTDSSGETTWTDTITVYHGGASGVETTAETFVSYTGRTDGIWGGGYFTSAARAGDVNGDGYGDLAVEIYTYEYEAPSIIYGLIVYGAATGRLGSSTCFWGWTYGTTTWGSPAGDVNGDGYDDVLYSKYATSGAWTNGVIYGSSAGCASAEDLDGDTYSELFALGDSTGDGYSDLGARPVDEENLAFLDGSADGLVETDREGAPLTDTYAGLTALGDLNGDGYDDAGLSQWSSSAGSSLDLYLGSADGLSAAADITMTDSDGSTALDYVLGLGDVDGDSYDDLVAYGLDGARIFRGGPSGPDSTATWTSADPMLGPAGDLNGDGFADAVSGADVYYGGCDDDDSDGVCAWEDCDESYGETTWHLDADGDGLGDPATTDSSCPPLDGYVENSDDCDDGDAEVGRATSWAVDRDGDGYTATSSRERACEAPASATGVSGDCDDDDPSVYPGADDAVGDEIDGDCDGAETCYADVDHDGYLADDAGTVASTDDDCDDAGESAADDPAGDCDDSTSTRAPGRTEWAGDEVDSDCDGAEICYVDADGDGYRSTTKVTSEDDDCDDAGEAPVGTVDCDDSDATVTTTTTWYLDRDGDGYGRSTSSTSSCSAPSGYVATGGDCLDTSASVHPGATETTGDEIDSDCDDAETCYADADGDGYRSALTVVSDDDDCDDAGEAARSASEDCDDDDATAWTRTTWYLDGDGDGYGGTTSTSSCAEPSGYVHPSGDCLDTDASVHPGATETTGDEIDSDCDGVEICWRDMDLDGYRSSTLTAWSLDVDCDDPREASADAAEDCDDDDADRHPDATEVCDGVDQDCDEVVDDDAADASIWAPDADGDGFTAGESLLSCDTPEGYTAPSTLEDCDDEDAGVWPGADEVAGDGVDQDCDGADEALDLDSGDTAEPGDTDAPSDTGEPKDSATETPDEDTGGGEDERASPEKSGWTCATGRGSGGSFAALLALGLALRRRRR